MAHVGYGPGYSISEFGFAIFVSIWTLLLLLYLVPASLGKFLPDVLTNPVIVLAVDALTMLFWFAAWVAVAAWRGRYDGLLFGTPAGVAAAFAAFGAFEWALFVASTVILALGLKKGGSKPGAAV